MSKCLACNSAENDFWAEATDLEYFTTDKKYNYLRCLNCGSLFIQPVPINELNTIYPHNYYSFVEKDKSVAEKIKEFLDKLHFSKILNQINKKEINVLDIGGGTGWLLSIIKKVDDRVSITQVVDLDENAGQKAKENGHNYFCGKIEDFETDTKFDFVLMLNLIEHVNNPLEILNKTEKFLSEEGLILIKTPNHDSLDARIFKNHNWGGYHCPRHWILFSKESFINMISRTNLKIKTLSYTQGAPFWTWSLMFWLNQKGIVSINKNKPVMFHPLVLFIGSIFALFDILRKPFSKTSQMFILLEK